MGITWTWSDWLDRDLGRLADITLYAPQEDERMKRIQLLIIFILLIKLFIPTQALAKEAFDDKVVFGGTFTLESNEKQDGSLVVFGGAVTLEQNSIVNGDVIVIGGTVEVSGIVNGNVVGIGGAVRLNDGAEVMGDLFTLGATLRREEGTKVLGQVISGLDLPESVTIPEETEGDVDVEENRTTLTVDTTPFLDMIWFLFRLFMVTVLAVILMLFLPKFIERIADAAVSQPVITAGAGLLTAVLAPFALIAITITILLIPVTIITVLVLFAAWLIGWISIGFELGRRISTMVNIEWAPAISAGIGTFILFLLFGGFRYLVPCIGFLPYFIISIWGLGAVLMTRFGTQEYKSIDYEDEKDADFCAGSGQENNVVKT